MFNSPKRQLEELERYRRKTNALNFAEGILVGGLIGFGIGLLMAPQAGRETLYLIEEKTKDALEKGKNKMPFKGCCDSEEDELEAVVVEAEDESEE